MCCKVLSLGYVPVLGEPLSVLLQDLISINISNPKGIGGITVVEDPFTFGSFTLQDDFFFKENKLYIRKSSKVFNCQG